MGAFLMTLAAGVISTIIGLVLHEAYKEWRRT